MASGRIPRTSKFHLQKSDAALERPPGCSKFIIWHDSKELNAVKVHLSFDFILSETSIPHAYFVDVADMSAP